MELALLPFDIPKATKSMELEQILDKLDYSREQLLIPLELLPDEALVQPQAVGDWSIAQLLVILTAWESEWVTAMMHLQKNQKPDKLLTALKNRDGYNAKLIKKSGSERNLDPVFDDFQLARVHVEDWLEAFSMKKLSNRKQFKWLNGRSILDLLEQCSYGYESKFVPAIEKFSESWLAHENTTITIDTIHVNDKGNGQL